MKTFPLAALLPFSLALCLSLEAHPTADSGLRMNVEAFELAGTLISEGRFVADHNGRWRNDHPTRSQENAFIRERGFAEYSKWYLAIDYRHPANTKARYKFPFGDFRDVHRCGLLAVKARARQYGYHEIDAAASRLLDLLDQASAHVLRNASINSGKSSL